MPYQWITDEYKLQIVFRLLKRLDWTEVNDYKDNAKHSFHVKWVNYHFFGVHGKFWGLELFSHNHFAEISVQKMQCCYVHREGGYRRLRYIFACRLILWKLINPMSREGPKLKSYMIISHCRSVLLLLTTVNWCPLFLWNFRYRSEGRSQMA